MYPFGHGPSYTTSAYDSLRLSASRARIVDSIAVWVRVWNSGKRAGDEVVQLYLRDETAGFTRPVQALRGFQRSPPPDLRPIVEPGFFTLGVGTSSAQLLQQAGFELMP